MSHESGLLKENETVCCAVENSCSLVYPTTLYSLFTCYIGKNIECLCLCLCLCLRTLRWKYLELKDKDTGTVVPML